MELENQGRNFQGSLVKSFTRFFRLMGIRLNNEQTNTIQLLLSDIEDTREQLISDRTQWNQQFVTILTLKQKENFEEKQRARFQKRLGVFEASINQIIEQHN